MPTWKLFRSRKNSPEPGPTANESIDCLTLAAISPPSTQLLRQNPSMQQLMALRNHQRGHGRGHVRAQSSPAVPVMPVMIGRYGSLHHQPPSPRVGRPRPTSNNNDAENRHQPSPDVPTTTTAVVASPGNNSFRGKPAQSPEPLQQRHIRSASVHSLRSVRSFRSTRSNRSVRSSRSGPSTISTRQRQQKAKSAKLVAMALAAGANDCFVCGHQVTGLRCASCDTVYGNEGFQACGTPIDFELLRDLADSHEYSILEAVVLDSFTSMDSVTATFFRGSGDNKGNSIVDTELVRQFYDLLASASSTCPMRAVLQGAQSTLHTRQYAPLSETELAYILVVLSCPAFTECSMFTKITGPLQKLARYASLRSRACMVLEICSGLIANAPSHMSQLVVKHLAIQDPQLFQGMLQLCNAYIGHRLNFHFSHKAATPAAVPGVPQLPQQAKVGSVLHDWYADDWRVASMAKVLSLYFQANTSVDSPHQLALSAFYNTVADYYLDVRGDFDSWQASQSRKRARFAFCQYPFLLSMGAKTRVFEHAVRREVNATIQRELLAILSSNPRAQLPDSNKMRCLNLKIRRTNLLEDSLRELSQWHKSLRRALRIQFVGEPGIDAGGPKKEWFLLFFRAILDPKVGVFIQDEESNYCWFATSGAKPDYCEAAGIALGLALFNAVSIDLNLPPILFKMLLNRPYTLDDVALLWPSLTRGLQNVLDYDGEDFEEVLGITFTAPDGAPLKHGHPPVTLHTKHEYAELLVHYLLERSSYQQFKHGFLSVAGGNALTLFQPAEIEALLRGDRQPIDVGALRQVTKYAHFGVRNDQADTVPVVIWFWDYFARLDPSAQAALLTFITATDRVPAAGIVNMQFRIACLGPDSDRLPIAHTCFNEICLYKYSSRKKLERKLHMAITESQGFGIR